jgi:hypothetical protein
MQQAVAVLFNVTADAVVLSPQPAARYATLLLPLHTFNDGAYLHLVTK